MLTAVALISVCLSYLTYLIYLVLYNLYLHPLARYPGPKSSAASRLPYAFAQIRGRLPFAIKALHDKYGEVVRVAPDELSFNSVTAWKDIYNIHEGQRTFLKDRHAVVPSKDGIYNILSATDSQEHARIKRVLSPGFSERALKAQEAAIASHADLLLKQLRKRCNDGPQDMVVWFTLVTFDIIADLTFGESLHGLESEVYHPWVAGLFGSTMKFTSFARVARFFPHIAPLLRLFVPRSLGEQRAKHAAFVRQQADTRLNSETRGYDFISSVIPYQAGNADLNLPEIYENFGALMIAGSENVATSMEMFVYHVLRNPRVHARLVRELRQTYPATADITFVSLQKAPYLAAALDEAMRIQPAAPSPQIRVVPDGGAVVAGCSVPADIKVCVPPYSINHDARYFAEPSSFDPERFLEGSCTRTAFQPFGYGPRSCLGRNLAMNEMKLILARLFWTFDMELCEGYMQWGESLKIHHLWETMPLLVHVRAAESE